MLHTREPGRRTPNPVAIVSDTEALRRAVSEESNASELDQLFLKALASEFDDRGGLPAHVHCEVRSSRVVFFDKRGSAERIARIELGRRQPDVLVRTALVDSDPRLSEIAPVAPHDKGPHMRRVRLSNAVQAGEFGRALARALSA